MSGPQNRHWESQWYRTTPRSFEHFELFYDPENISMVFAGESYKSFLLRRDGREERATEIGEEHLELSPAEIDSENRNEVIPVSTITEIRLRPGSLLWKPKQSIVTTDETHTFYHFSRKYSLDEFAVELRNKYPDIDIHLQ